MSFVQLLCPSSGEARNILKLSKVSIIMYCFSHGQGRKTLLKNLFVKLRNYCKPKVHPKDHPRTQATTPPP